MSDSKQPVDDRYEWTRAVLEVLVPKDRTCIESDKVAAIRNVEEQDALKPLEVAGGLIEVASGMLANVDTAAQAIALLREAREWITLGCREGRTVNL